MTRFGPHRWEADFRGLQIPEEIGIRQKDRAQMKVLGRLSDLNKMGREILVFAAQMFEFQMAMRVSKPSRIH